MSADGWYTVDFSNSSPVERDRDAAIQRAIEQDGRPLSLLGVVAEFDGKRWSVEVLARLDLLERLDSRARGTFADEAGREYLKATAAWIRGLPHGVCPELFRWDANGDGTWSYQRGTIEREKGRRR